MQEDTVSTVLSGETWKKYYTENTTSGMGDSISDPVFIYLKSFQAIPIWPLKIVNSVIFTSGIITNTLLSVYLIYYRRYRSPVFCVILSLCCCDLGVSLGILFWTIAIFPIILGPQWMCYVLQFFGYIVFVCSAYHMIIFAVLRFCQLVYPLRSRVKITSGLICKACLTIWFASFLHALGWTFFFKAIKSKSGEVYICWYTVDVFLVQLWNLVVWFLIPFLITTVFHIAKHVIIKYRNSFTTTMKSSAKHGKQRIRETYSRALAIVITVYLVTNLPAIVNLLRYTVFQVAYTEIGMLQQHILAQLVFYLSSINPWIYMFAAESVRTDIRHMFTCQIMRENGTTPSAD